MCYRRHTKDIILVAAAFISASCIGQQVQEANASGQLTRSGSPLQIASDSGEPTPIAVEPAFRGFVAPSHQPTRVGTPQSFFGQRTDIGIFTVGNFNPVSYISIQNTPHVVISSNKSSVGGGAEYRHWFSDRTALGLLYTQNPSDGKLLWQGKNYIWPQMRSDLSVLATERFDARNIAPFVCGGPGIVLTNGYGNSGWSAGFAFVAGLGTDYQLNRRFSARTGVTFLETKSGCYDDPTCHQTWGVAEDLRVGFVYKWGAETGSHLTR